jgi:hypothetical protein
MNFCPSWKRFSHTSQQNKITEGSFGAKVLRMGESEHLKILECIAAKLKAIPDWIFIYGEESRLATAALQIFAGGMLSMDQIKTWLAFLSADWDNAWSDDERALAFFNGRNFLRSLHYKLLAREDISDKEVILKMLRETLDQVNPIIIPELS